MDKDRSRKAASEDKSLEKADIENINKDMKDSSEEDVLQFIRNFREGSAEDFEKIYRYSLPSLLAISSRYYIPGGERDDLIQEGALGIMRAIMDYDETKGASFRTFMEMVVERRILNAIEKAGRDKHRVLNSALSISHTQEVQGEEGLSLEETIEDMDSDPSDKVSMYESMDEFSDLVRRSLSPLEKDVLKEMIRGGTYRQIALRMDKDPKTVDNAIQRIRKKLDRAITGKGTP